MTITNQPPIYKSIDYSLFSQKNFFISDKIPCIMWEFDISIDLLCVIIQTLASVFVCIHIYGPCSYYFSFTKLLAA